MLIKNETIEQREQFLWDFIHITQDFIKQLNKLNYSNYGLMKEIRLQEMGIIKMYYTELKELKRWAKYGK